MDQITGGAKEGDGAQLVEGLGERVVRLTDDLGEFEEGSGAKHCVCREGQGARSDNQALGVWYGAVIVWG